VEAGGSAPPDEKAERQRIYLTYLREKRPVGDVHIYILTPDGQPLDGMGVSQATNDDHSLLDMLSRIAKNSGKQPGEPAVKPAPQNTRPAADADALVLHLSARGATRNQTYRFFPAENWIVLKQAEWTAMIPAGEAKVQDTWVLDKALATRLLTKFYPQTIEVGNRDRSRIDRQELKLTVTAIEGGMARARIDGRLHMKHAASIPRDDDTFVDAVLLGFVEFDVKTHQIQRFRLVTKKATYGDEEFLAALRSVPADAGAR
jgi:hypothetical protein